MAYHTVQEDRLQYMSLTSLWKRLPIWLVWGLPLASLGYGIRFSLAGIPSTALEVYLLVWFLLATVVYGKDIWQSGWRRSGILGMWGAAWVATGLLAALYAPSVLTGLGLWKAYFLEPVFAFILLQGFRERYSEAEIEKSIETVPFLSVCLVAGWAVLEFVTGIGIPAPWNTSILEGRRATGPYSYPNAVALFVGPITAWATARFLRGEYRWLLGTTVVLGWLGVLAVRSDGGLLALLVATSVVLTCFARGRAFLLISALAIAVLFTVRPELGERAWKELAFQGWSGRVRVWMWQETWQMLKQHWLLGAGLGGYPTVFVSFHKKTFIEIFQYPHFIGFNVWSEAGLAGLIVFFGVLAEWAKRLWQKTKPFIHRTEAFFIDFAPLLAILVHGLVDVPYFKNDLALIFWILIFLTVEGKNSTVSAR